MPSNILSKQNGRRSVAAAGPAGFWFINDEPHPERIARQLDAFVEQGFTGVVLHARDGLPIPYPSRKWFDLLGELVDACVERGLEPWFYDENPFPTGTVGGMLLNQHPELVGHTLVFTNHMAEATDGQLRLDMQGEGRLLRVFLVEDSSQGYRLSDLTSYSGLVGDGWFVQGRRTQGYGPLFADDTCEPHVRAWMQRDHWVLDCPVKGGGNRRVMAVWLATAQTSRVRQYVDLRRRETTQRFLELTHEAALKRLGRERFEQFAASFTDEPHLASPFPWTAALPDAYREAYGDDLMALLPHLTMDVDGTSPLVRHRYRQLLGRLWHESFAQPMAEWCRRHGLSWTGHASPEEDPLLQVLHVPGWTRVTGAMHWPGVDQISSLFASPNHPHLLLGPKFVSSLAHQHDRPHAMVETLGVSGENLTLARMRRVITSLAVCGMTRFVLHGQMLSVAGHRKREAPPSIFVQAPYWQHMGNLSRYIGRLSHWLTQGKPDRPMAVVYPASAFEALLPVHREQAVRLARHVGELVGRLMNAGLDFDLVADHDLETGTIDQGGVRVGAARYEAVIVPAVPYLNAVTVTALGSLAEAGVVVYNLQPHVRVLEHQQHQAVPGRHCADVDALVLSLVAEYRQWLEVEGERPVYVHTRLVRGGQRQRMLWNPSDEALMVRLPAVKAARGWTPDGQPVPGYEADQDGVKMQLHGWQAVILDNSEVGETVPATPPLDEMGEEVWDRWQLKPHQPNCLVLLRWDVACDGAPMKPMMLPARSEEWDRHHGRTLYMRSQFVCDDVPLSDAMLVWECGTFCRSYNLSLNGHLLVGEGQPEPEADAEGACRIAVGQLLQRGLNTLEVAGGALAQDQMAALDPPRLEGTFRVVRCAQEVDRNHAVREVPGWIDKLLFEEHLFDVISPMRWPMPLTKPADWAAHGFPHYSGTMTYSATFHMPTSPSRLFLRMPAEQVDPVDVWVNGQHMGTCCWQPFQCEITEAVKQGENLVELRVSNTRINQDEGVPQPSGLLDSVRLLAAPMKLGDGARHLGKAHLAVGRQIFR